jgi:hypothetical protein
VGRIFAGMSKEELYHQYYQNLLEKFVNQLNLSGLVNVWSSVGSILVCFKNHSGRGWVLAKQEKM